MRPFMASEDTHVKLGHHRLTLGVACPEVTTQLAHYKIRRTSDNLMRVFLGGIDTRRVRNEEESGGGNEGREMHGVLLRGGYAVSEVKGKEGEFLVFRKLGVIAKIL